MATLRSGRHSRNAVCLHARGDLDGDGDIDLAVLDVTGPVGFLTNDGDATFTPPADMPLPVALGGLVVAQLDGIGLVDLAMANRLSDHVVVARNACDAASTPDLNGDGFADGADLG